jgi:hypothetical protein
MRINTDAELIEYASTSGVVIDAEKVSAKNLAATAMIEDALLNDYSAASVALLTETNSPPDLKEVHNWIFLHLYTTGDAARPTSIDDRWDDASRRLGFIAGFKSHYDEVADAVLIKRSADAATGFVTYRTRRRIFDRRTNKAFRERDEDLTNG